MIDWDFDEIEKIDEHYDDILSPSINFIYFCNHYDEILKITMEEEVLLPSILYDITYYTLNGINARYKVLIVDEEEIMERLLSQRMRQRAQRQEARNNGLESYYMFIIEEIKDFIEKYPFWKELIRK